MEIKISDQNLRLALEKEVNPPSLIEREINKKSLSSIRYLNINSRDIKNLKGVEWCENLEVLFAAGNLFEDINPLLSLKKLRILDLSINPNIKWNLLNKPFYSVEQLFLRSCKLENDLALEWFPNVKRLSLFHNNIKHIESLYSLRHLEAVDLLHNPISISGIEFFHNSTGVGVMDKIFRG